jgi:hypothetical protein
MIMIVITSTTTPKGMCVMNMTATATWCRSQMVPITISVTRVKALGSTIEPGRLGRNRLPAGPDDARSGLSRL